MSKSSIHPEHCCCSRCAPRHPAEQLYPLPVRIAVAAICAALSWAAVLWAAGALHDALFTWSAV